MRDVLGAATKSAGKLIDKQELLGWLVVVGTIVLGICFAIAIYLGMELIEFQKNELKNERLFKENLVDINKRVYELNQRSVRAIERNSSATEALVSLAETNSTIWRHLLVESQRATQETRRAVEAITERQSTSRKILEEPQED